MYIDEIVTFEATLDIVFSSMCTEDTCMQVYKANVFFFFVLKNSPVYTLLSIIHTYIYTYTTQNVAVHRLILICKSTWIFYHSNKHNGLFVFVCPVVNDFKSLFNLSPFFKHFSIVEPVKTESV